MATDATPERRRVLYVTRKYPPSVGGMEELARQVSRGLRTTGELLDVIALGRSQLHLAWWLPLAPFRVGAAMLTGGRVTDLLAGDPLVLLALQPVVRSAQVRTSVVVHGLDLTFDAPGYRPAVRWALRRTDRVVAISESTAQLARGAGAREAQVVVVNPGVAAPRPGDGQRRRAAVELRSLLSLTTDTSVLVTLGRLVERKGVPWFVEHVLPRLPQHVHYVVAGQGPAREAVEQAADTTGTRTRLHLLGRVDDADREILLTGGDIFVQPNVPVEGDVEGFGLVTVEATMRGTPVVASRLEGITDAVIQGRTGLLCEPENGESFRTTILELLRDEQRRQHLARSFQDNSHDRFSAEQFPRRLSAALPGPA